MGDRKFADVERQPTKCQHAALALEVYQSVYKYVKCSPSLNLPEPSGVLLFSTSQNALDKPWYTTFKNKKKEAVSSVVYHSLKRDSVTMVLKKRRRRARSGVEIF